MSNRYCDERAQKVKSMALANYDPMALKDSITDMLADIMHLCDRSGEFTFPALVERATGHYELEKQHGEC